MCTLIVLDRVVPGVPLVVASNRDEFYARPAAPPTRVGPSNGRLAYVAPQDLEQGGTWMGLNAAGVFVGLTNRATQEARDDRRSRGLLVLDALKRDTAEAIAADMREGLAGMYNPFHLLCADGRSAFLTVLREHGAESHTLEPGAHVVCNRDPDDPSSGKTRWIREAVGAIDLSWPFARIFGALGDVLRSHPNTDRPLENPCVHTPAYGTRSSTIISLGEERWNYWHSEGPPCETKYTNYTRLLDAIR